MMAPGYLRISCSRTLSSFMNHQPGNTDGARRDPGSTLRSPESTGAPWNEVAPVSDIGGAYRDFVSDHASFLCFFAKIFGVHLAIALIPTRNSRYIPRMASDSEPYVPFSQRAGLE